MLKSSRDLKIGISLGDPCGIGPEITFQALAALADPAIGSAASFTVIGASTSLRAFSSLSHIRLIEIPETQSLAFQPGRWSQESGRASLLTLRKSVELLKSGEISALVTAPVSKEAVHLCDPAFQGHTEFLADAFGVKEVGMMFVGETLKTIIVTRHMALKDVSRAITRENVLSTIRLADCALKDLFGLKTPVIGVCGLNPHAGENGLMGREEIETIIPAIEEARSLKLNVSGPFPADTIFSADSGQKYDAIVAMYHDQGLIPVKTLSFKKLVNLTVGLPFIRTSPAHGTAFDIAGKNAADATSMKEAIMLAVELANRRGEPMCSPNS